MVYKLSRIVVLSVFLLTLPVMGEASPGIQKVIHLGKEYIIGNPGISATANIMATSGLFTTYQTCAVGSWPEAVAIGDVNNDGNNEVLLTTSSYGSSTNDN